MGRGLWRPQGPYPWLPMAEWWIDYGIPSYCIYKTLREDLRGYAKLKGRVPMAESKVWWRCTVRLYQKSTISSMMMYT